MVRVTVARLGLDSTSNSFVVVLQEEGGPRFLPIWIGRAEAESIAAHLQGVQRERPMTHDLIVNLLRRLGVALRHVVITRVESSTFFAEVHLRTDDDTRVEDARPSDAIAIAVRCDAPVFVEEALLLEPETDDDPTAPFLEGLDDDEPRPVGDPAASDAPASPAESLQRYLSSLRPEDFGKFRP
jgi:bifunctional DNase/RNase